MRCCVGVIVWSLGVSGWSLPLSAMEELAPAPAPTPTFVTPDILEEVLVEAREPRYAAPTLRDRIGRVWVPVLINGEGPFRLVLDTGATTSAIVSSVAERLKLPVGAAATIRLQGATGAATYPYVIAEQMEIGDLLINDARLPIVPNVFGGAEGVLGTQGLADKRIHIDFRRDIVEIEYSRGKPRPAGVKVVKFAVAKGRLTMMELVIGGVRTKAIIDTGAQQTIGNNNLREALLLRRREVQESDVIGVTLDIAQGESIRIPPIAWGGVEVRNLRITFGEMSIFEHWRLNREPALLIGMDVIGTLETFSIDYPRRELYLRARH
jgi:predicted aspartyl protease